MSHETVKPGVFPLKQDRKVSFAIRTKRWQIWYKKGGAKKSCERHFNLLKASNSRDCKSSASRNLHADCARALFQPSRCGTIAD